MKLAVYRWLGVNAGDEAVQQALEETFGPEVEWVSIDMWETPENAIPTVNACDGLVIGGGTILGNLATWLVNDTALSQIRVPIGIFGTGIRDEGEISISDTLKSQIAKVVARAYPRGVRGPLSVELLQALGSSCPPVTVAGDTALLLDFHAHRYNYSGGLCGNEARSGIGVNIRVRRDGGEAATIEMIRNHFSGVGQHLKREVQFFACDQEWDPQAATSLWGPVEPYRDLSSFLSWIGSRRMIISERLHGAVLAHTLGIPAVLIAYERKCWDYARSIGLVTSCVAPGDAHGLVCAIENASADLMQARFKIERLTRNTRASIDSFRVRVQRAKYRRPTTLPAKAPHRPGDGRTLIGLLMIRDEEDVLAEVLRNHARFCDAIFVLDGTEGDAQMLSRQIALLCPKVREYWRDADTGLPMPLKDGARHFLLERARSHYGRGNWYAILHGDEIWGEDPRPYLDIMPSYCDVMAVRFFHFFPHTSQRETWDFGSQGSFGRSIEALASWYMLPPITEHRIFWDEGHADYDATLHSHTVPLGLKMWQSECIVKQYNYRSPEQATARARQRKRDGWQENHYQHLIAGTDEFFCQSLEMPNGKWAESVPTGSGTATHTQTQPLKEWRENDGPQ